MLLKFIAWIFGLEIIIFVAERCGLINISRPSDPRLKMIIWTTILSVSAAMLIAGSFWVYRY